MSKEVAMALDIAGKHYEDAAKFKAALKTINLIVAHQTNESVHPLTCGNDSTHQNLFPYYKFETGRVVLRCADCDYEQDNCAGFDKHEV